jgi:imidazolonepropionase-like amidohydrolase
VFEVEDYREIPYYFGVNKCWMTMKRGHIVSSHVAEVGDDGGCKPAP